MSTLRSVALAASLAGAAGAAAAQTTPSPALPQHAEEPAAHEMRMMDRAVFAHALLDQFEGRTDGSDTALRWDGQAWIGTDYDKLWLKTEGLRRGDGSVEDGQHELLYGRSISTYFDLQAGFRSDLDSKSNRNWGAIGIEGLAPLFFDVEATAYVSDAGHLASRLKGSYDLLITQRLILQPEIELNLYSKSDPGRDIGAGLSDIDAGLRLRYEFTRKLAPYLGVAFEQKYGGTATFAERAGESTNDVRFVFGIRTWF
jgi:copper resistance protein B